MREGWALKNWSEVLEIRSGRNQKEVEDPNGKYRILGSAGKTMGFANDFICEEGTTIIGRKGTINNPMIIQEKFWNVDTAFGLHARKELDKNYLFYFCLNFDFTELDKGSGRPSLVKSDLLKVQIPIPPLQEQQHIVAILDEAFETIEQAKANIQKNIENAKELFQSKLNDIFSQKGEGWEEKKLTDVITLKSGTTLSKSLEKIDGEIPYLKISDMNIEGNEFSITTSTKFVEIKDINDKSILPEGTIIFPKRGGAIATNKKRITTIPICVDLNTMGAIPSSIIYSEYLHFYFRSFDLMDIANGTTIPQINNYSFATLKISIPTDKSVQYEIVENLESFRVNLNELERIYLDKLSNLEDLKKSILQKAFAGELTNKTVEV